MTDSLGQLRIGTRTAPVVALDDFFLADDRRVNTFVSNFGNWRLPPDAVAALGGPQAHLEWLHDTGELALFGAVPHRGEAEEEVDKRTAALDELSQVVPGIGGMPVTVEDRGDPGGVRLLFASEVVPSGTRVAVLATVEHGPRVHELLWGWHRQHAQPDGWDWLAERLGSLT
jgi:hypothetical protein